MESNDAKKKYLRKYRKSVNILKKIERELEEIREIKSSISVNNDGMPRGSGKSDLSDYAARLDETERKLRDSRNERTNLFIKISDQISLLNDEDQQNVLFYRYIKGLEWWEVADTMKYSERHIHRIHGDALIHFELPKDVSECQSQM